MFHTAAKERHFRGRTGRSSSGTKTGKHIEPMTERPLLWVSRLDDRAYPALMALMRSGEGDKQMSRASARSSYYSASSRLWDEMKNSSRSGPTSPSRTPWEPYDSSAVVCLWVCYLLVEEGGPGSESLSRLVNFILG